MALGLIRHPAASAAGQLARNPNGTLSGDRRAVWCWGWAQAGLPPSNFVHTAERAQPTRRNQWRCLVKGVGSPAEVVQAEAVILSLKNRLVDSLSMRFSFSAADLPALCSIYKSNPFGYGSRRNSA